MPPIVTLTTDFGLRDPFVGIMKGVVLGICPDARLVDLSHEVAARDVLGGLLVLEAAVPFFPEGSVHLAVVDPGVGSRRRAIAVRSGGHYFVGPDNGLFTLALERPGSAAVRLEAARYRLPRVSRTFHGRDIFAPAAGHLAAGVPMEGLGPTAADLERLRVPGCRMEGNTLVGEVIAADRFGNLITSVTEERLRDLPGGGAVTVEVAGVAVGAPVSCYAEGRQAEPAVILGSTGRLEIFVRDGSAQARLGLQRGASVRVRPAAVSGACPR